MNELELLRQYKQQNPKKFIQKYGDVTPEEAAAKLTPNKPFVTGGVKMEFAEKKEKEMEFGATPEQIIDPVGGVVAQAIEEKPKRTRKAKEVTE